MRSIKKTLVVLAAALMLGGCVPSLHPFFTEKNIVFDDALLGTWINDSGDKCSIAKSDENHYEFSYTENTTARFDARLIELGGVRYLDLYPEIPDQGNSLYAAHLVPAHTLARVGINKDSLSIAMMNDDWLRKLSARNELSLAHERIDDAIVLTAATGELQAFILKHTNEEEMFGEPDVYHRIRYSK